MDGGFALPIKKQTSRQTRFSFPFRQGCGFCRRLLLAWLPFAWQSAEVQPRFLGEQVHQKYRS